MGFELDAEHVAAENRKGLAALKEDYEHLGRQLARRKVDIEALTQRATAFRVSVPSWGVGTGGTRFARFPGPGEPRNVFEKMEDCEVVLKLTRVTSRGRSTPARRSSATSTACATSTPPCPRASASSSSTSSTSRPSTPPCSTTGA